MKSVIGIRMIILEELFYTSLYLMSAGSPRKGPSKPVFERRE